MKLAFNKQAQYTDFDEGYALYRKRSRKGECVDSATYRRVVRAYCRLLANDFMQNGQVDLPCDMGTIYAAMITRKPQYRGKKFIGYGGIDYKTGMFDGKLKTFGIVYLPRHDKNKNLRCFGFVANQDLFSTTKKLYKNDECDWKPLAFDERMI